ncbi:MAG: hypothetical protein PW734_06360 [Verrucomicrobium sp.]|nr:hypothetical protein [Verrucomicrobium sp.]
MKALFLTGVLLIGAGIVALVYQGFSYTKKERVLDLGPIHADANRSHYVWIPPLAGAVAVVAGVACVVVGNRRTI